MALLSEAIREKEFDIRMVPRNLTKGLLLQDEIEKRLKKLSDDAENADYMDLETVFEGIGGKSGLR